MIIAENKICEIFSVKKSLNWDNIYTCGCYFNETIQIKQKNLNSNEIYLFVALNLLQRKTHISFYKKKYNFLSRKIFFDKKK